MERQLFSANDFQDVVHLFKRQRQVNSTNASDQQIDTDYNDIAELTLTDTYCKPFLIGEIPNVQQIYIEYENYKKTGTNRSLVDFDDKLTIVNEALEKDSGLLSKYQQRYDYFLTDEGQDPDLPSYRFRSNTTVICLFIYEKP